MVEKPSATDLIVQKVMIAQLVVAVVNVGLRKELSAPPGKALRGCLIGSLVALLILLRERALALLRL